MKRGISIFCACAISIISIIGSLSFDLKLDTNKANEVDNSVSISAGDDIEILGDIKDSYIEEYDVKGNRSSDSVEEYNEDESIKNVLCISSYTPSSYKNRKYSTAPKDQGKYSTCWGFATISAIESNLIKKGLATNSINLSEAGLVYFTYNKASNSTKDTIKNISGKNYLYLGGNKAITMYALASGTCLASETTMPYSKLKTSTKYNKAYGYRSDYMVRDIGLIQASNRNDIKNAIYKYGAVNASLYQYESNKYYNAKKSSYFQNSTNKTNHAVTVVGWDDTYSKNNFKIKPKKNGAWLVKNSWGTSWGDKGYYWVSYEDKALNYSDNDVSYYNMEKKNSDFLNLYEHDGTYSGTELYDTRYQSNVYTCKQNEIISDVLFYTNENNVSYELSIYTGVEENPTDGKLAYSQKGTITYAGCHSIKLKKVVNIKKGTKYSVVIRLANKDGGTTPVSLDASAVHSGWLQFKTVAKKGESFYKTDAGDWEDAGVMLNANCRIKVFTKSGYTPVITTKINNKGIVVTETMKSINDSAGKNVYYYRLFNSKNKIVCYKNWSKSNVYNFYAPGAGKYLLRCYIKDETGTLIKRDKVLQFKNTTIKSLKASKTKLSKGVKVNLKAAAVDGIGTLKYYFKVYKLKNSKRVLVANSKSYKYSNVASWKTSQSGTYYLKVYVKDAKGTVKTKEIKYNITSKDIK